ncbi:hypothetical protein FHR34_008099 [Kitasatospora kifunensis]|uniref:Uncharacterized protein n=1 Tax=Kitasatospora kifunensis TaxID=58351 RepID=A0A7W7RBL9_KITKI|nr:hypothetical protein [Kitasatospora kifunensis]MBB4929002.1 hypothetical protein [Kitasatospora kifunensis]
MVGTLLVQGGDLLVGEVAHGTVRGPMEVLDGVGELGEGVGEFHPAAGGEGGEDGGLRGGTLGPDLDRVVLRATGEDDAGGVLLHDLGVGAPGEGQGLSDDAVLGLAPPLTVGRQHDPPVVGQDLGGDIVYVDLALVDRDGRQAVVGAHRVDLSRVQRLVGGFDGLTLPKYAAR